MNVIPVGGLGVDEIIRRDADEMMRGLLIPTISEMASFEHARLRATKTRKSKAE